MSDKYFSFSDGLHKFGPFSQQEIEELVFQNKLMLTDMIYDSRVKQWSKIMQHPDFITESVDEDPSASEVYAGLMPDRNTVDAERLKKEGTKDLEVARQIEAAKEEDRAKNRKVFNIVQEGMSVESDTSKNKESLDLEDLDAEKWYIKEGGIILGPYHFLTIFTMIRDGDLDENNWVRKGKSGTWQIATTIFSLNEVQSFTEVAGSPTTTLLPPRAWKRKNLRRDFDLLFYVNDGNQEFIVQGFDVSEQGLAFVTMVPCFKEGQKLRCTLALPKNKLLHVNGEIVRSEVLPNESNEIKLTKYAMKLDQRIDLVQFTQPDQED